MGNTFAAEASALAWNVSQNDLFSFPSLRYFGICNSHQFNISLSSCHIIQFTFTVTLQLSQFPLSAGIILSIM